VVALEKNSLHLSGCYLRKWQMLGLQTVACAIFSMQELICLVAISSRSGQRRLIHHRYEHNLSQSRDGVPDPQDPNRRFFVGVHSPEWKGGAVGFPISIQNSNAAQFSPRPKEVWIEITP
jgi:hypothetical protein